MPIEYCDRSDLCAELSGSLATEFEAVHQMPAIERVLRAAPTVVAIVDMSPLAVGHALIVPREHHLNIAQAISVDRGHDLVEFVDQFLSDWSSRFGAWTLMEHGSASDMLGSACISHAHLHVLPIDAQHALDRMVEDRLRLASLPTWHGLLDQADTENPYFFVANADAAHIVSSPPQMPSQYLRIVAGGTLNIPPEECDWAVVIRRDAVSQTIAKWRESESFPSSPVREVNHDCAT